MLVERRSPTVTFMIPSGTRALPISALVLAVVVVVAPFGTRGS
jgi:hypothetical protein